MTLRGKPSAALPTYASPTRSGVRPKKTGAERRVEKDRETDRQTETEDGREGERKKSSLVDDPASKEPLRVGKPVGERAGIYPASPSPFATLVATLSSPSRCLPLARLLFLPAEDVPAQAPIQPIVGPRLITTLPNVRPSHRGRVRHGGPRALTNPRDIPASKRAKSPVR